MRKNLLGLVVSLLGATTANAAMTYTFDQETHCGSWCYHDPGYAKLTDGVVGNTGWALNEGKEWVGWYLKPVVNIDFDFGAATAVSSVSIGSTQNRLDDVVLPSFEIFDFENGGWILRGMITNPRSAANNHSQTDRSEHAFYTFSDLNITSRYIRIAALANGPWTFIDEVRFETGAPVSPVPVPGSYAMLLTGLSLIGLVARRRKVGSGNA